MVSNDVKLEGLVCQEENQVEARGDQPEGRCQDCKDRVIIEEEYHPGRFPQLTQDGGHHEIPVEDFHKEGFCPSLTFSGDASMTIDINIPVASLSARPSIR